MAAQTRTKPVPSAARIEANRRNAQKSTGPKTDSGKDRSRRNAVKHGLTGTGLALPEAIAERTQGFEQTLRAEFGVANTDTLGCFLVAQAALAMARLEIAPSVEWDARRQQIDRADRAWELDREFDALSLGHRLAKRPDLVSRQLLQTSQGCDWLAERWACLARAIEATKGALDPFLIGMMADLLGIPHELRATDPRLSPDQPPETLATLARAQCELLSTLKGQVLDPQDHSDRRRTLNGLSFDETAAARRLRGYESSCERRLRWALGQLQSRSPHRPSRFTESEARETTAGSPMGRTSVGAASIEPPTSSPPSDLIPSATDPVSDFTPKPEPDGQADEDVSAMPGSVVPASEKRTQPHPGEGPNSPADTPLLLNRRARRRAARQARSRR